MIVPHPTSASHVRDVQPNVSIRGEIKYNIHRLLYNPRQIIPSSIQDKQIRIATPCKNTNYLGQLRYLRRLQLQGPSLALRCMIILNRAPQSISS